MKNNGCLVYSAALKAVEKTLGYLCPWFGQWTECYSIGGQLSMGEYPLSKLRIVDVTDRLHGIAALLTDCRPNILANSGAEMPAPIIATHKVIFELRGLRLK